MKIIAGVDEVGRGCLAGPVVAAAVILKDFDNNEINDSKKMSKKKREELSSYIKQNSIYSIGEASVEEIDKLMQKIADAQEKLEVIKSFEPEKNVL